MNIEVVYLVAIFAVGCIAVTFRAILFNISGERFVARLRTKVGCYSLLSIIMVQTACSYVHVHVPVKETFIIEIPYSVNFSRHLNFME